MVSEEGYQIALLTFRMNNPVMMTTEAFNQNVSKLFSEHKLVTDNLPLSVTQEPTEKPLKNNNAIVITTVFIYHSFRSRQTRVSWVQYSSTQFIGFHMKSHNPYKPHGIHSKIFAVIGCSTSIVAIATFSNLISVPVISVPYKKNIFQLFCCTLSTYKLASSPGHDQILSHGSGLGRKLLTSKSKCKSDSFTT